MIPKIIHQSYKTTDHPYPAAWQASWLETYPDWEYFFHTDADNRLLVSQNFPQHLHAYDLLPRDIIRADFARFVYLYIYGGMYADLDYVSLRPLTYFLADLDLAVSANRPSNPHPCHNALMLSKPGHPFWLQCMESSLAYASKWHDRQPMVELVAGPLRLADSIAQLNPGDMTLIPYQMVTPLDWYYLQTSGDTWNQSQFNKLKSSDLQTMRAELPNSYAVTFWNHGW